MRISLIVDLNKARISRQLLSRYDVEVVTYQNIDQKQKIKSRRKEEPYHRRLVSVINQVVDLLEDERKLNYENAKAEVQIYLSSLPKRSVYTQYRFIPALGGPWGAEVDPKGEYDGDRWDPIRWEEIPDIEEHPAIRLRNSVERKVA